MSSFQDLVKAIRDAILPASPKLETKQEDTDHLLVAVRRDHRLYRVPPAPRNRRVHTYDDLGSFAEWIQCHAADVAAAELFVSEVKDTHLELFVDTDPRNAHACVVACHLPYHPTARALLDTLGKPISHELFFRFVRAHRAALPLAELLLTELGRLNVTRGSEITVEIDERGYTRYAGSSGSTEVSGSVPPEFTVVTPIFPGIVDDSVDGPGAREEIRYTVEVLLSLKPTEDGVVFRLDAPALPLVIGDARLDVAKALGARLPDGYLIGLGTPATEELEFGSVVSPSLHDD